MPGASTTRGPLVNLTVGAKKGDKQQVLWTPEADRAFEECKAKLTDSVHLAHPHPDVPLVLRCDASDIAIGAALDQRIGDHLQPLGFFFKKLSPREGRYKVYDRELLAIYRAVKHFRHLIEGREVIILTDHKPLVHAFDQRSDHACDRMARQLEEIVRFSTRIEFVSGVENVAAEADAYSHIDTINMPVMVGTADLAKMQRDDDELKLLLTTAEKSSLQLRGRRIDNTDEIVYCDVGGTDICPYVPKLYAGKPSTTRVIFLIPADEQQNIKSARTSCGQTCVRTYLHGPGHAFNVNVAR